MTLGTGSRIDPAIDLVLAQIVAAVRQRPLRGILVLVARLDLFLVGMAIGTERFLMAGGTGKFLLRGIKPVLKVKIVRLVIEGAPTVAMALRAIDQPLHFYGVYPGNTVGIRAGIENAQHQRNQ